LDEPARRTEGRPENRGSPDVYGGVFSLDL
jgi:hypothetical protein